jgi:hypothetical protein
MNTTGTDVLPPLYPHPTIVVLPGGAAHAGGRFITGAEDRRDPLDAAWDHAHEVAAWCGREVRVSVGRANGTVETYALGLHGGVPHPITFPVPSPPAPGPGWRESVADRHDFAGYYAARARDWKTAARLCMTAAERRHRLRAPGPRAGHDLDNAVRAWLNFRDDPEALAMGFELAHILIRLQPHQPGPIASVLGRVTHLIRAGARP